MGTSKGSYATKALHRGTSLDEEEILERGSPRRETTWDDLPEIVQDSILAKIPLRDLFRARLVCRRWDSLIHCSRFQQTFDEVSKGLSPYPLLLNYIGSDIVASFFETSSPTWMRLPSTNFCGGGTRYTSVRAGAGGLLCLIKARIYDDESSSSDEDEDVEDDSIIVCNPLTKCWRELPPTNYKFYDFHVTHMVYDESTKVYQIILAGVQSGAAYTISEIYDSSTNAWRIVDTRLPPNVQLASCLRYSSAYCDGILYCVAWDERNKGAGVIAYNIDTGEFSDFVYRTPGPQCLQVVGCGGKLFVVVNSSSILELLPGSKSFQILARKPQQVSAGCSGEQFPCKCVATQDSIMHFPGNNPCREIVVYSIHMGRWSTVPNYHPFYTLPIATFSFKPSLGATV